ncbi:hypothetical protein VNI00_002839 [Paramarasmius palmivorus]|uniref:Protein-tyrosine-phosphatase n=1 Tax=Paramarasmius palmivorus TaxID=297713 RepID=A0AAW0DXA2_9AGAR
MLGQSQTLNTNPWATARSLTMRSFNPASDAAAGPYGRTASVILPQLYLSDYFTARDAAELSRLGITHVVSVLDFDVEIPEFIAASRRMHIRIGDRADVDILAHLEHTTDFIKKAIEENADNKVLVHCFQGISRSATVVCAYLVATAGLRAIDSIAFVKSKRRVVSPNVGFRQQLEMYATYSQLLPPEKQKVKGQGMVERIRRMQRDVENN